MSAPTPDPHVLRRALRMLPAVKDAELRELECWYESLISAALRHNRPALVFARERPADHWWLIGLADAPHREYLRLDGAQAAMLVLRAAGAPVEAASLGCTAANLRKKIRVTLAARVQDLSPALARELRECVTVGVTGEARYVPDELSPRIITDHGGFPESFLAQSRIGGW